MGVFVSLGTAFLMSDVLLLELCEKLCYKTAICDCQMLQLLACCRLQTNKCTKCQV